MNLQERIKILVDLGFIYDEKSRNFISEKGKIDQDIVEYGNDILFEQHLKKIKL